MAAAAGCAVTFRDARRRSGAGDADARFEVARDGALRDAMAGACAAWGRPQADLLFTHLGREVLPDDTPERIGMAPGGGVIDVRRRGRVDPAPRWGEARAAELAVVHTGSLGLGAAAAAAPAAVDPSGGPLDLEWTCPACRSAHPAATAAVRREPRLHCVRCGWEGHPRLRELPCARPGEGGGAAARGGPAAPRGRGGSAGVKKVATSGRELHADHIGQHVEAPVSGMIAMVSQVQRSQQCAGLICYCLFCLNFLSIISLIRPVGRIYDVQSAIYRDLALEPVSLASRPLVFQDVGDWGDVWDWVDRVLIDKVYGESHYGERVMGGIAVPIGAARAPYSRFTVGRYNRVVNAIRFRQARVVPTLPRCEPDAVTGAEPTQYQQACTLDQLDVFRSCNTPVEHHSLSRPCWGAWSGADQDMQYPSGFQLETAQAARDDAHPERDLLCPQNCDEVLLRGTSDVPSAAVLAWVLTFQDVEDPDSGAAACRESCDGSRTSLLGNLSDVPGFCGSTYSKPLSLQSAGCWGDVVDVPLEAVEARRLIAAMRRERWTSEGTRMFVIDLNTYNANLNIATAIRVTVEAEPGGRLVPALTMWSCPLNLYRDSVDYIRMFLEVVFACAVLNYALFEVQKVCKLRERYFYDPWNYVELSNILIYALLLAMYLNYVLVDHKKLHKFGSRSPTEYFDLYTVAVGFNNIYLASFNFIYGVVRFLKHLRFHTQFEQLWETMRRSMNGVTPTFAIFVTFLLGFACAGHWLFGSRSPGFRSLPQSVMTLVLSIHGGIDFGEISSVAPLAAPLFSFSWFVTSWGVLLSTVIATVVGSFPLAKVRFHRMEDVRRQGVELGTRLPSPLYNMLYWVLPRTLWRLSGLADRQAASREASRELEELLVGVDLQLLWQRLLEAAEGDVAAVDAEELCHLFGGSQKEARMFISRACAAGGLPRVAPPRAVTTEARIARVGDAAARLQEQLGACRAELLSEFPELGPHLSPPPRQEDPESAPARAQALEAREELRGRRLWKSSVAPPQRGELSAAAFSLQRDRLRVREHGIGAQVIEPPVMGRGALGTYLKAAASNRHRPIAEAPDAEAG